ncbi:hypothetical protein ATERTT37_003167 [Aspergillus terreus]
MKGFLDIDKIIEHRPLLDKSAKRPGIPQECNSLITASMYSERSRKPNRHTKTVCESCYWSRHYGDESFTKSYKYSVSTDGLSEREAEAKYTGLLASVGDVPQDQKSSLSRRISQAGEKLKARRLSGAARESTTHAGALVSLRDLPIFIERFAIRGSHQRALSIGTDVERRVWEHQRVVGTPKRHKVMLKQVVGAPFSGALSRFVESDQEAHVVNLVVEASEHAFDSAVLSSGDQKRKLDERLHSILESMKALLQSRLKVYLHRIVQRLLDSDNPLTWNPLDNNCRAFCDSLLDYTLYSPLVNGPPQTIPGLSPLYLMSFVSPPQKGYMKPQLRSKFDAPEGFIEEYIRRLHFGRHNDADIIDSLQEYWYDWGGFSKPLYEHQDVFPWDCSEAYKGSQAECGQCNLSKHVWAFPFDSWSIVTLHLQRDQHQYPGFVGMTDPAKLKKWTQLRLSVLQASSKLHRAAAAIHYYDVGVGKNYFLARWAALDEEKQKHEYEKLRDARMRAQDIPATVALQVPKFYATSQRHGRLAFYGFQERRSLK